MITKIDIQSFGLFSDYNWDSEVGSNPAKDIFKKVNIIYGRNYSGKTTLSRIFGCVENEELHEDYKDAKFIMSTDGTTNIDQSNLAYSKTIRVYNSDFVKENLSWLHDIKGEILPFTLLGGDNTVVEGKLKDIDTELGLFDLATQKYVDTYKEGTLYFEENKKKQESTESDKKLRELIANLEKKIVDKAREIKGNGFFVSQKDNYDKRNLNTEINDILNTANSIVTLSSNEIHQFQEIIKEAKKDIIPQVSHVDFKLIDYVPQVKELVSRKITLSKVLTELIENDLLQAWVDEGRSIHKDKNTCGFCGNLITLERRKELDGHFSKESDELKKEILKLSDKLKTEYSKIEKYWAFNDIKIEHFYSVYNVRFVDINNKWKESLESIKKQLNILLEKLNERFTNPFKPLLVIDFSEIDNNFIDLNSIIDELNLLIKDNEDKSTSIEQDKIKARKALRYHIINGYLKDIDYNGLLSEIESKKTGAGTFKTNYDEIRNTIKELETEKDNLKKELRDEGRAAEKINEHLRNFFGHDSIQLKPSEQQIDDEVITRFVVKRGDEEAKNLSEGECSLVAFCYFIAKIEEEIQDAEAKEKLIIYIDDPISSLDNNHIFFIFGLIESVITKSKKFNQLFISTHNLEFLRYLKRLTVPNDEIIDEEGKKKSQKSWSHYLIYKNKNESISQSHIRYMPKYLSSYTTEYNFLFSQIYEMAIPKQNKVSLYENQFSLLYNLPNNMRKFLECFLFYKYPDTDNPLHFYLSKLFDGAVHPKVNRIINEYSHLTWGERGTIPTDVAEAEETARLILKAIKDKDIEHYEALCKSIKVDSNVVLS